MKELLHINTLHTLHVEFVDDPSAGFRQFTENAGRNLVSLSLQCQTICHLDLQAVGSCCSGRLKGLKLICVQVQGSRHLKSGSDIFRALQYLEVSVIGLDDDDDDSSDEGEDEEEDSEEPTPELFHFFLDNCTKAGNARD